MYSLTIKRYDRHLNFDTVEELREELSLYLSPLEKKSGLLDRLTTFDPRCCDEYGYVVKNWKDFRTECYVGDGIK